MTREVLREWAVGFEKYEEDTSQAIIQALDDLANAEAANKVFEAMIESMRRSTTKRPYPEFTNHS